MSEGVHANTSRLDRRSEEHTSELQSQSNLVCRLLLEKKKKNERGYRAMIIVMRICVFDSVRGVHAAMLVNVLSGCAESCSDTSIIIKTVKLIQYYIV